MAQAITAYDYIAQNNRKTWMLVLLFPVSLLILIWIACLCAIALAGDADFIRYGIGFLPASMQSETGGSALAALGFTWAFAVPTFIVAFIWMGIAYLFGDKMMMAFAGATPMEREDNPKLFGAVENVAMMAGLPCPKIYIIQDNSLNAFATGQNPKNAAIAFTTGIIDKLQPLELEGVIAHEMSHIGNRDIRLDMLVITGVGVFGFLGRNMFRLHRSGSSSRKKDGQLLVLLICIAFALLIFDWIVAPLIHLALSRTREYAADATGAKIIHNPKALADALEKISTDSRVEALDHQKTMAVACIASPLAKLSGLTSTHPPIEERIRRLRHM